MSRSNRPVTSREYKLPLNPDRFVDRVGGATRFRDLLQFILEKEFGASCEPQDEEKRRTTWYLDTPGMDLERNGYILRVRDEQGESPRFKIMLKYRHGDRYLSARQQIKGGDKFDVKKKDKKFEEDIIPPFVSKFSRSVAIRSDKEPAPATLAEAAEYYPILEELAKKRVPLQTPILRANNFTAHEVMRYIGRFMLNGAVVPPLPIAAADDPHALGASGSDDRDPTLKACLNFWYLLPENPHDLPLVAEFSFSYDALDPGADEGPAAVEEFAADQVEGAETLYTALQEQAGWLLARSTTKTDFALRAM
jgi:hypothetical protein